MASTDISPVPTNGQSGMAVLFDRVSGPPFIAARRNLG